MIRDEIAMRGCFIDIFELDYVGVIEFLQNLYLVIKHLKTRRWVFLEFDDFDRIFSLSLVTLASVDMTGVARAYFIFLSVKIMSDGLDLFFEADCCLGVEEVAGGAGLP